MNDSMEADLIWDEIPGSSVGQIMENAITDIESKVHENYGWDGPPIILGVLYLSTVGGLGSVSVQLMSDLPEAVSERPIPGFPFMVDLMVEDIKSGDPDMEWLDEIVCRSGFVGWLVILAGLTDQEPSRKVRNLMYYSRPQGILVSERLEGEEPKFAWAPEQSFCEESYLARTVVRLNEISHYVRLRSWVKALTG